MPVFSPTFFLSHIIAHPPHLLLLTLRRLSQELELKQHSLALLEERARGSEAHQLAEAVAATEAELGEAKQASQDAKERKQELVQAAKVR